MLDNSIDITSVLLDWLVGTSISANRSVASNWGSVGAIGLVIVLNAIIQLLGWTLTFIFRAVGRVVLRIVGSMGRYIRRSWYEARRIDEARSKAALIGIDGSINFDLPTYTSQMDFRLWRQLYAMFAVHDPHEFLLAKIDGPVHTNIQAGFSTKISTVSVEILLDYLEKQFGRAR